MAYPKIIYDTGAGDVNLNFTYPSVMKPGADDREAITHVTYTSTGLRQTVVERIDVFKNLQLDYVPMEDLPAWEAFVDYALTGGEFDYYADSASPTFETFSLDDDKWTPKFAWRGMSKYSMRLRKAVADDSGS